MTFPCKSAAAWQGLSAPRKRLWAVTTCSNMLHGVIACQRQIRGDLCATVRRER